MPCGFITSTSTMPAKLIGEMWRCNGLRSAPAAGIIFRETGGDYDLSWHPAPRRQYIINLDGGVKITASDGEAREIGAGEVILVEDVSGKGHLSQSIGGKMRHSVFVPVE
jgi:hypothetical protein